MLRSRYVKAPFKWLKKGELANQITLLFNSRVLVHKNDQGGRFKKGTWWTNAVE